MVTSKYIRLGNPPCRPALVVYSIPVLYHTVPYWYHTENVITLDTPHHKSPTRTRHPYPPPPPPKGGRGYDEAPPHLVGEGSGAAATHKKAHDAPPPWNKRGPTPGGGDTHTVPTPQSCSTLPGGVHGGRGEAHPSGLCARRRYVLNPNPRKGLWVMGG